MREDSGEDRITEVDFECGQCGEGFGSIQSLKGHVMASKDHDFDEESFYEVQSNRSDSSGEYISEEASAELNQDKVAEKIDSKEFQFPTIPRNLLLLTGFILLVLFLSQENSEKDNSEQEESSRAEESESQSIATATPDRGAVK